MYARVLHSETHSRIVLEGQFVFGERRPFVAALDQAVQGMSARIVLDLCKVTRLDSAALALMLVARDKLRERGKTLRLKSAPGATRDLLMVARFNEHFDFE